MKKNFFSAFADSVDRHRPLKSSISLGAAGFSFMGFWQEYKTTLLMGAAIVLAVIVFIFLIFLRRKRSTFPEIIPTTPKVAEEDQGMTLIETLPETKHQSVAAMGIYGKIEVVVGSQQISSYLVTDNPLPIGRDPSQAMVIIQEPIVSKLHCSVFANAGKVFIKDLNSTNGIYMNEEKVVERELNDKDVVFLGKKGTVKLIYHR